MEKSKVDIIIPTYKPNREFTLLIERLQSQTIPPHKIILMNTEKDLFLPYSDKSRLLELYENIEIHHISQDEFDHGKTRDEGIGYSDSPYFICMTQDAIPENEQLIEELLRALKEKDVAVAYARQLPRPDCTPLEEYMREFNYPHTDRIKSGADLPELGVKTYFCSNVCAAYNRQIYDKLGGFIKKTIFNEDMIYAALAIKAGYLVAYRAGARVIHSHSYTGWQQFTRNFDLGVSQADHPEIFSGVPSEKEGKKLVKKTLKFLIQKKKYLWIAPFIFQSGCKLAGYRLGKAYKRLPKVMVRACSMNVNYWRI